MESLSSKYQFNFFRYAILATAVSLIVIAVSYAAWMKRGYSAFGLDFVGGTEIVAQFEKPVDLENLRHSLEGAGFEEVVLQPFEREENRLSIRTRAQDKDTGAKLREAIKAATPENTFNVDREDYVGPVVGDELRTDSMIALLLSICGILAYVSFRFEWRFAVGAIAALFHDVIIAAGMVALCNYQFTMGVIAALMTIIGYSVNDTIIIFDRIRENLAIRERVSAKKGPGGSMTLKELMNLSLNQTLSRTLLTSLTVLFVVVILWLQGGPGLEDFAFTLVVGTIAGSYSTIFIACPTVLFFTKKAARTVPVNA